MKLNKCKNCLTDNYLHKIKDFQYQFDEEDPVEELDVLRCDKCGCIHWIEGGAWSWEWIVDYKEDKVTVGNWSTDQQVAKTKIEKKEVSCV